MKKILIALLALMLAFSMVACNVGQSGGSVTTDTDTDTDTDAQTTTKADVNTDGDDDSDDGKDTTPVKPADTTNTESNKNETNKPADTAGDTVVTTPGSTDTPAANSVFNKLFNDNKDKKLSFIDAVELFEDLIATPVAIEDNSDSYRVTFDALLSTTSTGLDDVNDSKIPVSIDYTYIKNGDFQLKLALMSEEPYTTISMIGGTLYWEVDNVDGETIKIKATPTEAEIADFESRMMEFFSNMDFESLMGLFMGYGAVQTPENEKVELMPTSFGLDDFGATVTGGDFVITTKPDGSIPAFTDDIYDDTDAITPDDEYSDPMADLAESIMADVFADEAPADVAEAVLGDAALFFDEEGNFHIAAKGGFEYLNTKLAAIAKALDEGLPAESLEALELPEGVTLEDIVKFLSFKTNSYVVDLVCKPDGTVCGLGVDFGIKSGYEGESLDLDLILNLTVNVDSKLTLTAPADKDEYVTSTLTDIMDELENSFNEAFGPSYEDFPEINIEGMTAADLALVPEDGVIYLSSDPHKRAMQMAYIMECEDPVSEFDCKFMASVLIDESMYDGETYTYFCTAPDLDMDDPYYSLCYMVFTSNSEYAAGDTVDIYFAFVDTNGYVECIEVSK